MKKLYLLFTFLVFASIVVFAGDRSEQQMRNAAMKALVQNVNRRAAGGELKELLSMQKLKIYGFEEGGFAVIAKDDRYAEVLGSSNTKFAEGMPCGFKWWLDATNEAMENNVEPMSASSRALRAARRASVSPLITTKWGQRKPYNNNCKLTVNGQEYSLVTGCVATAMAQVMNYYRHPAKGKGEHSYMINYSDWGLQTYYANFENSYYDWNNMLDDYSSYSNSYTVNQYTEAVAKLMSDCGIAVNMGYHMVSSGTWSGYVPEAMSKYFSYSFLDETTKYYNRNDYSTVEWMNLVYIALDNNHPILYRGDNGGSGGHMFVIHGYDSNGNVYVNWGWNGSYDGYFSIDMLAPSRYSFNDSQGMTIPIPADAVATKTYKLTYIVDGNKYKEYELKSGESITPEPAPTKTGYTFSGWSSIPPTMPAKDVTVTGTFSKGSYQLIYKVDGAVYKTLNYNYGATITPEPSPTKEGYSFSGWSNVPSTMPANNITVTGSFAINSYTLTYIVDGETYRSYELKYGAAITPESEPTKDGYTFSGWSDIPTTMPSHNVTVTGEFRNNTPSANTFNVEINGIYYNLIGKSRTAEVTNSPSKYSGSITIPESVEYDGFTYQVTQIGESAFASSSVTSVSIPSSITVIGVCAFYYCRNLTSVSIPAGVTRIGRSAFQECVKFSSIILPNSIIELGSDVFCGCKNLSSATLGDGITTIPSGMFDGCTGLVSIKIPDTVTRINSSAFRDCTSLESITLPQGLTFIGGACFSGCTSLTSIIIPDKVTYLDTSTFWHCTNLKTVTIGKSVKNIFNKVFAECKSLESVVCMAETPPTANSDAFENSYIEYVTLYVPKESISYYQTSEPWKNFKKIVALTDQEMSVGNIIDTKEITSYHSLDGKPLNELQKGINIVRLGNGKIRKVVVK